jgi:hypothetical protein
MELTAMAHTTILIITGVLFPIIAALLIWNERNEPRKMQSSDLYRAPAAVIAPRMITALTIYTAGMVAIMLVIINVS